MRRGVIFFFGERLSVKRLRDHSNSFVHDGRCGQTSTLKGEPKRRQRSPRLAQKLCDESVRTLPKTFVPEGGFALVWKRFQNMQSVLRKPGIQFRVVVLFFEIRTKRTTRPSLQNLCPHECKSARIQIQPCTNQLKDQGRIQARRRPNFRLPPRCGNTQILEVKFSSL